MAVVGKVDAQAAQDELTALARDVYQTRANPGRPPLPPAAFRFESGDPVMSEAIRFVMEFSWVEVDNFAERARSIFATAGVLDIVESQTTPGIGFHLGSQTLGYESAPQLLSGVFASAQQRLSFFRTDSEDDFVQFVRENFEQTIRALYGRPMSFYQLVAYSGIWLEEGRGIRTPWGELVVCDRMLSAPSPQRRTASAVLAVRCRRSPRIEPGLQTSTMYGEKQHERAAQAALLLPLACVLALDDPARRPEPAVTWQADLFPMAWVGSYGGGSYKPPTKWIHLTPDEVNAVTNWCRRLNDRHHAALEIAGRRTLSAIAERNDPADQLVDAVIAWESMFGGGSEPTLRITSSLTILLESNLDSRSSLREKLATIYGTRSAVVNGSRERRTREHAIAALEYAIAALRELYLNRPHLIPLNSEERSLHLLLQEQLSADSRNSPLADMKFPTSGHQISP